MIRLRSLLETTTETKPKVLFIGDSELKTSYNFAKKLMASKRISRDSKIKIKPRADSETLLNIIEDNSESHYDLIVLFFNNLQDLKLSQVVENLQMSISIAHKHDSKIVLFTLPTLIHITGKDAPDAKEKRIHHNINNWIRNTSNADFIIDIELDIDDSAYYESNSTTLNAEGHFSILKRLNKIVQNFDINMPTTDTSNIDLDKISNKSISTKSLDSSEIEQLQQLLLAAGYVISKTEISNKIIGNTTKAALIKYHNDKKHNNKSNTQTNSGITLDKSKHSISGDFSADILIQATKLLIQFESYSSTPYWDVNNWRIGYGSSTITTKDGAIYNLSSNRSVKPNIIITEKDADRDISRRLSTEFIPMVKKQLGDAMGDWTDGTIAALVSVCYNYGSLPQSVVTAAKTKITSNLIEAVRNLSSNKARRNDEANYIEDAENYIPVVTNVKDKGSEIVNTNWNKLTNIFGTSLFTGAMFGVGKLLGSSDGGDGGDWAGTLPKLISILPAGEWEAQSQKRNKIQTKSGNTSDHYIGKLDSYAGDFSLTGTFGGDEDKATAFAIEVARKAGKNIDSWEPYVGKYLNINSGGYRVQIIWQSMVGGNHYDHVHVGVRKL
jgi:GH24 family phage-related lysozyme (muramidase)